MKKIISLLFITFMWMGTAGCSNQEAVDLSESNLNHALYNQLSPGQQKQYFFEEHTLLITAGDTIKPEMFENDDYEEAISEEHKNIQVIETKKEFTITGDGGFNMTLIKNPDGLLINGDGEEFIKANELN